ncbi:MAG: ATP-binding cassette domain-containing protein [Candidatus Omnitrophota bacterium]
MTLLEIQKVKKYFSTSKNVFGTNTSVAKAVDGVSLSIDQGESLGLVGESGCGKTTLARMAINIIQPDSGNILFEGQDIHHLPKQKKRFLSPLMQMVFQDPFNSLDPRFNIRGVLKESTMFLGLTRPEEQKKMEELLCAVGLPEDILERFPYEFSGGERQRIAIARALAPNPKLLILDEAVSSLDVLVQEQILNLLSSLQEKFSITYFFISHNLRVVKRLCPKIAVMYQGKIVELGPRDVLLTNPLHPYTQRLLSAALSYQAQDLAQEYNVADEMQLIEKQKGHFVLE